MLLNFMFDELKGNCKELWAISMGLWVTYMNCKGLHAIS